MYIFFEILYLLRTLEERFTEFNLENIENKWMEHNTNVYKNNNKKRDNKNKTRAFAFRFGAGNLRSVTP